MTPTELIKSRIEMWTDLQRKTANYRRKDHWIITGALFCAEDLLNQITTNPASDK